MQQARIEDKARDGSVGNPLPRPIKEALNQRMSEPVIPDEPIIRGEKVWLRGFTDEDLVPYERFVMSHDAQWAGYRLPTSRHKVKELFDEVLKGKHGNGAYYFVVSPLGSSDFIGTTWLWNYESRLGGPEFSIFMHDADRWGSGLGTDAVNATLDFAFGFTDVEKIWLATLVTNDRAQRCFAKAGFTRDGLVRRYVMVRGAPEDAVLMSILREEWKALDRLRSWDRSEPSEGGDS